MTKMALTLKSTLLHIELTIIAVRRSKKLNAINVVHVQKCSLISKAGHYVALCQKLLTRQ
jgi:hypothetical protein